MKIVRLAIVLTSLLIAQTLSAQEQAVKVREYGIGLSSLNSFSLQYRWGNQKRLFNINATIGGSSSSGKNSDSSTDIRDTTFSSSNTSSGKTKNPLNFNTSLSFSILYLKKIEDKFGFTYGPTLGCYYNTSNSSLETNGTTTVNYSYNNPSITGTYPISSSIKDHYSTLGSFIGFTLGAYYKINASFIIYANISPSVYYSYTKGTRSTADNSQSSSYIYDNSSDDNYSNNNFGFNLTNSTASLTIVYRITKQITP